MTPSWLLDLLAAIMLAVAAASAAQLVTVPLLTPGPWRPVRVAADANVAHALMGIAMAGMFTSSLATLPNAAWAVIFGLTTAWFGGRVWIEARGVSVRSAVGSRCMLHMIHGAAMLYMFLALNAPEARGGGTGMAMGGSPMGTLEYPTAAGVFTLLLIGYSVWDLDQLSGRRFSLAIAGDPATGAAASGRNAGARAFLVAPTTLVAWQVILGIAMAFMLVITI